MLLVPKLLILPHHYQVFNTRMLNDFQRRRELVTHLRAELQVPDSAKLFMCYQPVHSVQPSDKLGMEAPILAD